jgi:polyisoprenoid-binding protein YceI
MKPVRIIFIVGLAAALSFTGCKKGGTGKNEEKVANPALSVQVPDGAFAVDPDHTSLIFRSKHVNVAYVYGRFNDKAGYVIFDEKNPEKSKILLNIDTASVDTNVKKRDDHLRSPDFFDAKKFPIATFTSKAIKSLGGDKYSVSGTFDLHGVQKELTVHFTKTGFVAKDPWGMQRIGGEAVFTLKRSDYGVNSIDSKMPGLVGDDTELRVSIEALRK